LFVDFRHSLGDEVINAINEKIVQLKRVIEEKRKKDSNGKQGDNPDAACEEQSSLESSRSSEQPAGEINKISIEAAYNQAIESVIENKGTVIMDATCCPQDIAYPTDLTLLSDVREKAEELIDFLCDRNKHGEVKPRTCRKEARKEYLHTAQKKKKNKKEIRKAVGKQLRYLKRDITIIHRLLDSYPVLPFRRRQRKYFHVIQTLYAQQKEMFDSHTHTIEHRIVSIHQPHVRPIVRGKAQAKVEFGAKIHVTMINGIYYTRL
jgi:hypothetical protein